MNHIKKILKEEIDKRDMLKDRMKHQLTTGGKFNLGKVVKTFGADNYILKEAVVGWAEEGIQRMKAITPSSEAEAAFIKMLDGIYVDVWFERFSGSVFFLKGDPTNPECWFELENSDFYCSNLSVWSFFENEYSMKFEDIKDLIKPLVEEAFRLRGVTPLRGFHVAFRGEKRLPN